MSSKLQIFALSLSLFISTLSPSPVYCLNESQKQSSSGAKELFDGQLTSERGIENLGLAYSIELLRDGKSYLVDNRFPFVSGDKIRFHVRPNVDGYMYIVLDSRQDKSLLFPYPHSGEDNKVGKGATYSLPQKGYLVFDNTPGVETLKLVLSTKVLDSEAKQDQHARSIVIKSKRSECKLEPGCMLDFALGDGVELPKHEQAKGELLQEFNSGRLKSDPSLTLVSTRTSEPLVVDMLLRHQPKSEAREELVSHSAENLLAGSEKQSLNNNSENRSPNSSPKTKIENQGPISTGTDLSIKGSSVVTDKWALLIGISKFKDPKWNLNFPDKDARDFGQFLIRDCQFAPDHVKVLTNNQATREQILTDIGSKFLPLNAKQSDLVVIFIATHGTAAEHDVARKNFLVAYDTDPLNPFATGIELQDLARNVMRRLNCKRVVLVLDTCHSGAAETLGAKSFGALNNFNIEDLLQGSGHLIIASASANQIAHDSLRYKNGIFTKHFMDGLKKFRTLHQAFDYTQSKVSEEATRDFRKAQIPVLKDAEWHGEDLKISAPSIKPRKPIVR